MFDEPTHERISFYKQHLVRKLKAKYPDVEPMNGNSEWNYESFNYAIPGMLVIWGQLPSGSTVSEHTRIDYTGSDELNNMRKKIYTRETV